MELGDTKLSKKLWEMGTLDLEASLNRTITLVAVKFLERCLLSLWLFELDSLEAPRLWFESADFLDFADFLDLPDLRDLDFDDFPSDRADFRLLQEDLDGIFVLY